ncbi:hypothetical protein LTR85_001695 [Meristemomyces frigidus]|nr:hypothetical protein LTR85_001695 [Meristemomyces frigidus]
MAAELPTELIEHIFTLANQGDKPTLAAICITNKLGRRAVTPIMYQSVGIAEQQYEPAERTHRLQLLCRTLLENPRLAAIPTGVKHKIDQASHVDCGRLEGSFVSLVERRLGELNIPRRVYIPVVDVLEDDQFEISEDVYLVLMLLLCTGLQVLEHEGELNVFGNMGFMRDTLEEVAETAFDDDSTTRGIRVPRPDLTRPARFSGDIVSHIKELIIGACSAQMEDLQVVLQACPDLRTLDIEFFTKESAHRRFDWPILGIALRQSCPNLEQLRLDHERDIMMDDEDIYEMGFDDEYMKRAMLHGLGSLKQLSHLTTLTIPKNALFGTRGASEGLDDSDEDSREDYLDTKPRGLTLDVLLPPSLRRLTVICEDKYIKSYETAHLEEPAVQHLDEMTVTDCQKDVWFTKTEGPNEVQKQREREMVARRAALVAQRAAMRERQRSFTAS